MLTLIDFFFLAFDIYLFILEALGIFWKFH